MNLFESLGLMNRTREDRLLEHNSPRSIFIWLLLLIFLLGANAGLALYSAVRLHRFVWAEVSALPMLVIIVGPLIRTIYRQLDR